MAQWNTENPGGLVFVIQARDVNSPQGKWIQNMLSIDFENELGERYFLEDEQLQFFYVDMDEPYDQELSGENWPHRTTCNEPLQTDAQKQGEYCCWIIRAGCGFLNWNSCRFRIKDDCNNWTRSENLVPEGIALDIIEPDEEEEFDCGEEVTFIAELTGNTIYDQLEEYIQWEILEPAPPGHQTIVLSDYTGPDFQVEIHDPKLVVRASLSACNLQPDQITVYDAFSPIEIVDMGFIVHEQPNDPTIPHASYGGFDGWLIKNASEGVVVSRPSGECEIEVVIKAECDANNCANPPPHVTAFT